MTHWWDAVLVRIHLCHDCSIRTPEPKLVPIKGSKDLTRLKLPTFGRRASRASSERLGGNRARGLVPRRGSVTVGGRVRAAASPSSSTGGRFNELIHLIHQQQARS